MSETVLVERVGAIAVLTLNAPSSRNAISTEMRTALRRRFEDIELDADVRAIVLTGAAGTFSSGADIRDMVSAVDDPAYAAFRLRILQDVVRHVACGVRPVVAAIEGVAAGAGLSLAMASDYIVASDTARFAASFVRVGLGADCGLQFTLTNRIGAARARRMIMLGEMIGAVEAHQLGMVDDLVPSGEVLSVAIAVAERFAEHAPLSMAATKAVFSRGVDSIEEALALEMDIFSRLATTRDHEEAKAAFLEKRPPEFAGR